MNLITKFYEPRNCIVCTNIFYVARSSSGTKSKHSLLRSRNARTCSDKCGKEYHRNRHRYVVNNKKPRTPKHLYSYCYSNYYDKNRVRQG